jgi:hypothetical protein
VISSRDFARTVATLQAVFEYIGKSSYKPSKRNWGVFLKTEPLFCLYALLHKLIFKLFLFCTEYLQKIKVPSCEAVLLNPTIIKGLKSVKSDSSAQIVPGKGISAIQSLLQ